MGVYHGPLVKRSFTIQGHRTSVALEPEFWAEFDNAVQASGGTPTAYLTQVDEARSVPLASALRVHLLLRLRDMLRKEGREKECQK